jgi:hypothetical protein
MSSINPNNIDGTYPIAGQDNDSQGFRDNFTNIKNNLTFAKAELEDLQNNAILKSPLSGTTLDNNLNYSQLSAAQLKKTVWTKKDNSVATGTTTLDWTLGHYHTLELGSTSTTMNFTGWPTSGYYTTIWLDVYVSNVSSTLTLSSGNVTYTNLTSVQGESSNVLTFPSTGHYMFEFATSDNGTNITVRDLLRNYESVVTGTVGDFTTLNATTALVARFTANGYANITANTTSSSTTTGALKVAGGAGIVGNLYAGNVNASAVTATNLAGSLTTAAQGNVTSVGTLTGLSVSGDTTLSANVTFAGGRRDAGYLYVGSPASNFSTQANVGVSRVVIDPTGTLANGTVTLPAGNVDAAVVTVSSTTDITAFAIKGYGNVVVKPSANVTLTAGTSVEYFYHASEWTWYKVR